MSPDNCIESSQFLVWEDLICAGIAAREERDECSWRLGDLANLACTHPAQGGRPKAGEKEWTKSAFALAIGEQREVISALAANSEFFTLDMRAEVPPQVSWRMCSEARRRSGWRPGVAIEPVHRERAFKFILEFADRAYPTLSPEARARSWQERVGRIASSIRGVLELPGVSERLRRPLKLALDAIEEAVSEQA